DPVLRDKFSRQLRGRLMAPGEENEIAPFRCKGSGEFATDSRGCARDEDPAGGHIRLTPFVSFPRCAWRHREVPPATETRLRSAKLHKDHRSERPRNNDPDQSNRTRYSS